MNNTDKLNFIMVNNNLLANTMLSSTQKLFISFILGWQRSELTCRMTNRSLASHFGMKYAGIRSLLNKLNKYNFFETTQYGHTNQNSIWTSGHEMRVNEDKLIDFLKSDKIEQQYPEYKTIIKNMSKSEREETLNEISEDIEKLSDTLHSFADNIENNNISEHETTPASQTTLNEVIASCEKIGEIILITEKVLEELAKYEDEDEVQNEIEAKLKSEENDGSTNKYDTNIQYKDDDLIDIEEIMTNLGFNRGDITHFVQRFRSKKVIFEDFACYFTGLIMAQDREEHYFGVEISKEQEERFKKMIIS